MKRKRRERERAERGMKSTFQVVFICSSLSANLTRLVMHRGTARTDEQSEIRGDKRDDKDVEASISHLLYPLACC